MTRIDRVQQGCPAFLPEIEGVSMAAWEKSTGMFRASLLPLLLLLCATGCGKSGGEVTGTVSYRDKPLSFGSVSVMGEDGIIQVTQIDKDGSYRFDRVAKGPAKFVVVCIDPKEAERTRAALGRGGGSSKIRGRLAPAPPAQDTGESQGPLIPLHYGDFSKTDLKFTVESGTNKVDLNLHDPQEREGSSEP
jgi:hypothetical protein